MLVADVHCRRDISVTWELGLRRIKGLGVDSVMLPIM
jgi:hypothetical protein